VNGLSLFLSLPSLIYANSAAFSSYIPREDVRGPNNNTSSSMINELFKLMYMCAGRFVAYIAKRALWQM